MKNLSGILIYRCPISFLLLRITKGVKVHVGKAHSFVEITKVDSSTVSTINYKKYTCSHHLLIQLNLKEYMFKIIEEK